MIERVTGPMSAEVARELSGLMVRAYEPVGMRPWTATELRESAESSHVIVMTARDREGTAQGFLCLRLLAGEGEILCLAVDPDCRRRGVASRLFDATGSSDEGMKTGRLVLEVAETNVGAIALYQMLGFVDIAIRRDYYRIAGNRVDAHFMERRSSS